MKININKTKEIIMKTIITLIALFFIAFEIGCNAQPNTKTTFEVGIVNPQPTKHYLFFEETKTDSSTSQLVNGMDYLNPNVSSLIKTLQNTHQSADTLFGEFQVNDLTTYQFIKPGLVQVDNASQKYSGMKTLKWFRTDKTEGMEAGFFVRKK